MSYPSPSIVGTITEVVSDGSINIPNTTPPSVGDYLVAFVGAYISGGTRNIGTAPAGWTKLREITGDEEIAALYVKTATSTEVAASNFTFTITGGGADVFAGVMIKVTNVPSGSEVAGSEIDTVASDDTTLTYVTDLTPDTPESIILSMFMGSDNSATGTPTIGSYASTPSLTWVELADIGGNNSGIAMAFSVAYAEITGLTNITERSATVSEGAVDGSESAALILNAIQDDTVSLGVITIGAAQQSVSPIGDANVTLGQVSIGAAQQSLTATNPDPTWSNKAKSAQGSTTNKDKS